MDEEDLDSEEDSGEDVESGEEEEEGVSSSDDQLNEKPLNSVGSSDHSSKSKRSEEEEGGTEESGPGGIEESGPGTSASFQQAAAASGGGGVVTADVEESVEERPIQQDLGSDVQDVRSTHSEQPAEEGTVEDETQEKVERDDVGPVSMTQSEEPPPSNVRTWYCSAVMLAYCSMWYSPAQQIGCVKFTHLICYAGLYHMLLIILSVLGYTTCCNMLIIYTVKHSMILSNEHHLRYHSSSTVQSACTCTLCLSHG